MKTDLFSVFEAAVIAGAVVLAGCGSDSSNAGGQAGCPAPDPGGMDAGCPASTPGDVQTPPTGGAPEISAWLAKGDYKAWTCEPTPHDARSPSPHGKNRICSNAKLSAHGAGEYPIGSAGVKELFDAAGTRVVGHAVYLKVAAGKGEAWYWFDKTDADGLIANGLGNAGTPKTVCVGCHASAGSDANHSGHVFVFTQVK